jgi:uncharacterized OB-fold protein
MSNREIIQTDQTAQSSHCKELSETNYRRTKLSQDTIVWAATYIYFKQNRLLTAPVAKASIEIKPSGFGAERSVDTRRRTT